MATVLAVRLHSKSSFLSRARKLSCIVLLISRNICDISKDGTELFKILTRHAIQLLLLIRVRMCCSVRLLTYRLIAIFWKRILWSYSIIMLQQALFRLTIYLFRVRLSQQVSCSTVSQ